jgi:hypothetical protein
MGLCVKDKGLQARTIRRKPQPKTRNTSNLVQKRVAAARDAVAAKPAKAGVSPNSF